jgi:hypothetical protein
MIYSRSVMRLAYSLPQAGVHCIDQVLDKRETSLDSLITRLTRISYNPYFFFTSSKFMSHSISYDLAATCPILSA